MRISESELLDALASAAHGSAPDDARTLNELLDEIQIPRDRMLAALHLCRAQGRLEVYQVWRTTLTGRRQRVPGYTITPVVARKPSRKRA